jgi:pyrimidine nucleoside transport protein
MINDEKFFRTDTSVLDAASNGASQAIPLVLNIIANLVAFVAVVAFADGLLLWITGLMGFENVGIQFILGKVFMPLSWLIGVDWEDCEAVGNVIGTKTIINEFVAFRVLGDYIERNEISVSLSVYWKISSFKYYYLFFTATISSNSNFCNLQFC